LEGAIARFHTGWTTVLSHSGQYHELRSGHAHVFTNPFDMPLPTDREAIWQEIDEARKAMRAALDDILSRLRDAYVEVNIHKTNGKAWQDYLRFKAEVNELDGNDERSGTKRRKTRKSEKTRSNKKIRKTGSRKAKSPKAKSPKAKAKKR
jgi:hypothetical protein